MPNNRRVVHQPYRTPGSTGMRSLARTALQSVGPHIRRRLFQTPIHRQRADRSRQHHSNRNVGRGVIRNATPRTVNTMGFQHVQRKVSGRKNARSIVHRKRNLKITPRFRKKVKKVIAGTLHHGTYMAVRQGSIGIITADHASTTELRVANQGGYVSNIIGTKVLDEASCNSRVWFGAAMSGNDGFTTGDEWQFFSPLKLLDAASVLWNQKTASRDYTGQSGNLNTVHNGTTGVEVVGTAAAPEIQGLKIHVSNAYVKMTMKNNSQRHMLVEVYKCVPKTIAPLALALSTFAAAIDRAVDGTNTSICSVVSVGSVDSVSALLNMPGVEPNQFPSFNTEWKYEKVKIKIAPGETTSLFFQGPKDYILDYDKVNKGNENIQGLAYKHTTMNVMMSVTPDLQFSTATPSGASGRWFQNIALHSLIGDVISLEMTEVYNLKMPEIIGFQNGPATDAGERMYTLNKRLNRRAYANFVSQHTSGADPVYTGFDVENPADGTTDNRFL